MTDSNTVRLDGMRRDAVTFDIAPSAEARDRLAHVLGLLSLRKLRFHGQLKPVGRADWHLEGRLGASVVQSCAVTLAPVPERIDVAVRRRYLAALNDVDMPLEQEMPEDDESEALPRALDLGAVMEEALSLSLPDFPHAKDVGAGDATALPPGALPLAEEETKPFAGLADALKGKLQ